MTREEIAVRLIEAILSQRYIVEHWRREKDVVDQAFRFADLVIERREGGSDA